MQNVFSEIIFHFPPFIVVLCVFYTHNTLYLRLGTLQVLNVHLELVATLLAKAEIF